MNSKKGLAPVVVVIIALIIVAAIGGYFIVKGGNSGAATTTHNAPEVANPPTPAANNNPNPTTITPAPTPPPTIPSGPNVKTFQMTAKQWGFTPSTITVKQGDLVKISITSLDVSHGISIPDYNIDREISQGNTVIFQFIADKKGTFPFKCSVLCGAGHSGMKGQLIVE